MSENLHSETPVKRRDFLLNAGRLFIGGGVAYGATDLFIESLDCEGHSVCDACLAVNGCDLPLGVKYKKDHVEVIPGEDQDKPIDLNTLKELNHGT